MIKLYITEAWFYIAANLHIILQTIKKNQDFSSI